MATAYETASGTISARARPARSENRTFEQALIADLIPRFLVANGSAAEAEESGKDGAIGPGEAGRVADLAVSLEAHLLLDRVESFLRRGVSAETLFVDVLAPAARHLGKGWEEDRLDFVEVTMGLWRLQEVLRDIASRAPRFAEGPTRSTALFAPVPGDQHSFGAAMVGECFAIAGWETEMLGEASTGELLDMVSERSFDLVGLTLSRDALIDRLPGLITAVRSVSMNPRICVMIGGRTCNAHPGLVQRTGADGTAADANDAVVTAERLVRAARALVA